MRTMFQIALCAFVLVACGEQTTKETEAPTAIGADRPASQSSNSIVSGSRVELADGRATVAIPAGWSRVANSNRALEIEAERYKSDLNVWARCAADAMSLPNLRGLSQEQWNDEMANRPKDRFAPSGPGGALLSFSNSEILDGSRLVAVEYEADEISFQLRQVVIAHGMFATAIHLDCDSPIPVKDPDRVDIDAFLNSLTINKP